MNKKSPELAFIKCPKCGHKIEIDVKLGLTHDVRMLLIENPKITPQQIFEILLSRGHRIQHHSQPRASIWTVWKRVKAQLGHR